MGILPLRICFRHVAKVFFVGGCFISPYQSVSSAVRDRAFLGRERKAQEFAYRATRDRADRTNSFGDNFPNNSCKPVSTCAVHPAA
jgi:hypothetical protein